MVDLRTEYPRPQLIRKDWLCLNGTWEFEIDRAEIGQDKKYWQRRHLDRTITVPYCPESELSGVGVKDFLNCVWYRRTFTLPPEYAGKRALLHFGAVDYEATVYVNGKKAGGHKGGYTPFCLDITDLLTDGENVLTVQAVDHLRNEKQPAGKQSTVFASHGCFYTRTTGIWQTVWLEPVNTARVENYRVYPDVSNGQVTIRFLLTAAAEGMTLEARASYAGNAMGGARTTVCSRAVTVTIPLRESHLWEIGEGRLYGLDVKLSDKDEVVDRFAGYFGLREVGWNDKGMTLNGKIFFGRYVLDQGFYPDGIYTAPSDEALKNDILKSQQLGFNGARLHQKVFEPRFLYWADRLGYLVWGEHANWGLNVTDPGAVNRFLPEWMEAMERDFSHPSLIGWCPFNETWDDRKTGARQCNAVLDTVFLATRALDPTRPVIDTSGNYHVRDDVGFFDVHDYEQDPDKFASYYANIEGGEVKDQVFRSSPKRQHYTGGPVFMSEYGGIKWNTANVGDGWGYGNAVTTEEEFIERYRRLTDALLDNGRIMAMCYTQLYDVEQECNGLMTYDRKFKFDPEIFRKINTRKAKIEE